MNQDPTFSNTSFRSEELPSPEATPSPQDICLPEELPVSSPSETAENTPCDFADHEEDPRISSDPLPEAVPETTPSAGKEVPPSQDPLPHFPEDRDPSAKPLPRFPEDRDPYNYPNRPPQPPVYYNPSQPHVGGSPYTPPGQTPLRRDTGYGQEPGKAPYGAPPTPQGSNGYPQSYPRGNNGYPQGYPQGNNGYPQGYPQRNNGYPQGYPQRNNGYPQGYPQGNNGYPQGYPQSPYGYPRGNTGMGNVPPTPPPFPNQNSKKKSNGWLLALLIVGCVLIGILCGVIITSLASSPSDLPEVATEAPFTEGKNPGTLDPTTHIPRETQPLATASGEEMTLNQIYSANVPAIVGITNEATQNVFGQISTVASTGSGFIISSDGEILTNYHVVQGAEQITVSLYDGRSFPASLIGYEAESDVALIKIDAENLPVCAIGDSDRVFVGEQIAAIGNPMGELTYTMTVGYVSAVDRFVNTDGTPISMIQVDAAINPGNSGGPVFNLYGEVIGITTAKYSGTLSDGATLEGLGFAIPINDITEILNDLRINGKVPDRAYMGVVVSMLPPDAEVLGIDHGVHVQSVQEDGSAYKAGVQANDVILKIGDAETNAYENLQQVLRGYRAGDETTITVYRNGKTLVLPIVFDAKPETTEIPTEPQVTEPAVPTEPEDTESPWETFPWGDFPWSNGGG